MRHFGLISLLALGSSLFGQTRTYTVVCGEDSDAVYWYEESHDNSIRLRTRQGTEQHEYILTPNHETVQWNVTDTVHHTHISVVRRDDQYYIHGEFKGEEISSNVDSEGDPWFQNIAYNGGLALKDKESVVFECFRPDNLKLFTMAAEKVGATKVSSHECMEVKVRLTGFLSAFWGCIYHFDATSYEFIAYEGVNGAPGTPVTIITRKK